MNWTTEGACSKILWIDGPPIIADDQDNPVTLLAATVVSFAAQSGVPIISYFGELRREESSKQGHTAETQGLLAIMNGLVRQMVELLLPAFDTDIDISTKRISRIDGTMRSWDELLDLFRDLLHLMPDKVFCVIDGLHWLDDRSTEDNMRQMIEVLRMSRFRVLFTTSGRSATLRQTILDSETITADETSDHDWMRGDNLALSP